MNYLKNTFKGISKPLLIMPVLLAVISITMMVSTAANNGYRTVLVQSAAYIMGAILIIIMANMDYQVVAGHEKRYTLVRSFFFLLYISRLSV